MLESVVGKDFLPRGTDIVTKRPLVVTMKQLPAGEAEFGVFAHATPKGQGQKFYDFEEIRAEIDAETRRFLVRINQNRQGPEIVVHKSPMFLEVMSLLKLSCCRVEWLVIILYIILYCITSCIILYTISCPCFAAADLSAFPVLYFFSESEPALRMAGPMF